MWCIHSITCITHTCHSHWLKHTHSTPQVLSLCKTKPDVRNFNDHDLYIGLSYSVPGNFNISAFPLLRGITLHLTLPTTEELNYKTLRLLKNRICPNPIWWRASDRVKKAESLLVPIKSRVGFLDRVYMRYRHASARLRKYITFMGCDGLEISWVFFLCG